MKLVIRTLVLSGVLATPTIHNAAASQSQWYVCYFSPAVKKGKKPKTYRLRLCKSSADSAYYTAVTKFSKALCNDECVVEPDECEATHEACVD